MYEVIFSLISSERATAAVAWPSSSIRRASVLKDLSNLRRVGFGLIGLAIATKVKQEHCPVQHDHLKSVRQWAKDAGIKNKHLSFHCFRHTYATLQLTLGTDLYTLSKMMGHREAKTTQIYGKIVDQKKRDAADKMKL